MLSLFKLKKKSKKAKDQSQDDEKENTSSPTKVKKVEKTPSSAKESGKKKSKVLNENKKQDETENNKNSKKSATLPAASTSSPSKVNGKSGNIEKLNTLGLDSPYQNGSSSTKPLVVDVTTTPILASAPKSPKQHLTPKAEAVASEPSPISASGTSSGSDGVNGTPATPANNANVARVPVLSASDAVNTSSFVRGNFLSSTISGSDLNRYLNSGYMHSGDSYLQKPVDPKYAKSPHFHRPPNFSFYRNVGPNYVITPRRNANRGAIRTLIMSSSSMSSNARSSRVGQTMPSNSNAKRVRSNSPVASKRDDEQAVTTTAVKSEQSTVEPSAQQAGEEPVTKINIDNEEPIRLSKFSGGYEPDPQTPRKIESLDWPAPPYPAAVPELRARSRSSSNRYGHSTVYSVDGAEQCLDDSDQDEDEEDVNLEVTATTTTGQLNQSAVTNSSVATSTKRPKSRPTPKYQYRHGFFDNDYDDYLLQYKPRSEWRKHLERHKQISGLATTAEDVNNNKPTTATAAAEVEVVEEDVEPAEKLAQEKLKKEIDEIAKLENESSMAADLIKEIKAEQKMAHRKLKIDPWKASRTPSAKAEPSVRTRFDSPVNASPSRVFYYNIAGSHRIPNTPSGHTISTTTPGTAGFLHSSTTASTSFFSGTGGGGGVQSAGSNSSTLIASGSGGVGGVAVTSSSSNNAITNAQSINYNLDSSATSSAALMASPSSPPPKSATLPVTASSTSSSAQQHYSAYSSSSAASSSHRANTLSQASTSPTITANGTPKAGMANIVYNIAVPKPGYGLSSPNKSVTLPNSVRYAGMPTHRSVDFERRAMSPIYDSTLHSPPSPRTHYERVRLEQELKLYAVIEQFAQLTKSTPNLIENPKIYPYEVLSTGPRKKLPAEVDRQNLERHLSDDEFRQLFGMSLKDFYQLPYWKRVDMKKVAKLF